jgi:hypothetical protein
MSASDAEEPDAAVQAELAQAPAAASELSCDCGGHGACVNCCGWEQRIATPTPECAACAACAARGDATGPRICESCLRQRQLRAHAATVAFRRSVRRQHDVRAQEVLVRRGGRGADDVAAVQDVPVEERGAAGRG